MNPEILAASSMTARSFSHRQRNQHLALFAHAFAILGLQIGAIAAIVLG